MTYDRPLYSDERGLALMNQYSGGFAIGAIFQLTGPVNPDSLRRSLDFLQQSYPRLNCRIVGDLKKPQFQEAGTEPIPLEFIQESEGLTWRDVAFKEVNTPLPREKYLLKCFLVSSSPTNHHLISVINHCITDGLSFMRMNDLLLKYYADVEEGKPLEKPDAPFPESDREMSWRTHALGAKFSSLKAWIRQIFATKTHNPQRLVPDRQLPVKERQGNFTDRFLELDVSRALISRCKQEKAKLNGTVSAAMMLAVAEEFPRDNPGNLNLSCQSYVDLRSQTSPRTKDDYMGLMTSSVCSFHKINSRSGIWDISKDIDTQIQEKIKTEDFKRYPMLLANLIELSLSAPEDATQTFSVTNLGKVRMKKNYGDLVVERFSMFPHITIYSNLIVLCMYKFRDRLGFTLSYSYPCLSSERVERIGDRVVQILTDIVS